MAHVITGLVKKTKHLCIAKAIAGEQPVEKDKDKPQMNEETLRKLQENLENVRKHGGRPPPKPKPAPAQPKPGTARPSSRMDQFRMDWETWKKSYGGRVVDLTQQVKADPTADYKLLGVAPGASKEEIRKSFYKLAKQNHPDQGGDPDKFREMMEAYSRLTQEG